MISVVIPTYKRRQTVGRAIESALGQTLAPAEVIVVDDASGDGTAEWIARAHPGVKLIALASNRGAAAARNAALAVASGDVVAFLDSDDWWEPGYLASITAAFDRTPGAVMAVCDVHMVLNYGPQPTSYVQACRPNPAYPSLAHNLLLDNFITTMSCVAVKRDAIARAGLLDERLRVVHDKEWYLRLARLGGVACTGETLVWRTIADDNLVADLRPFLADQFRFLDRFFDTPAGAGLRNLRWRARTRMLEGFAYMAQGRAQYAAAAQYLLRAFAASCRDFHPQFALLVRSLAAQRGALRASAAAAFARMK